MEPDKSLLLFKVDASSKILYLAQNAENLIALTQHEVLLGALARTLREEGHRSYSLASNILSFFHCLSRFSTFAFVIADYKIGSLTMDLLQGEMAKTQQVTKAFWVVSIILMFWMGQLQLFPNITQCEAFCSEQVLHELEESQMSNDFEAFENLTRSYTAVLHKQDSLLIAALSLLLNISAELKNETRIVNKGSSSLLDKCFPVAYQ